MCLYVAFKIIYVFSEKKYILVHNIYGIVLCICCLIDHLKIHQLVSVHIKSCKGDTRYKKFYLTSVLNNK